MKIIALIITLMTLPSIASECREGLPLYKVESTAKNYVGQISSVKLTKDKKENICVYRISGENGYVVIDANSGELLRFSKRKSR